ncbi:hypothetical protein B0F90DRAFT_1827273 [Multifurca ochricompacta]|uniref:Uncharacterized protein n=1 Tax=Multifurca ochricompacta TaxID=376703 RepID=A0AAD4QDQ1_9AGAM|nr:hypothetical protein B0F90DRAFT_1827273 [Multifurca ochricompacta]
MHALDTPTWMEDRFPRRAEGFAMDWAAIKRIQSLQHLEQKVKSRFGYTRATWHARNAGFGSKAISIAGLTGANRGF